MKLGLAILRTVLGALFIGHGTQKLFGWFEGQGLRDTGDPFDSIGLRPGRPQATVAGVSETIGGALIATGFLTPIGCALITGVMTQAIRSVHAGKGPWFSDDGWEYNVVLIAAVFTIAELGPGDWSLDHALDMEHSGPLWATAAVGAGVAGPVLTTRALFLIAAGAGLWQHVCASGAALGPFLVEDHSRLPAAPHSAVRTAPSTGEDHNHAIAPRRVGKWSFIDSRASAEIYASGAHGLA